MNMPATTQRHTTKMFGHDAHAVFSDVMCANTERHWEYARPSYQAIGQGSAPSRRQLIQSRRHILAAVELTADKHKPWLWTVLFSPSPRMPPQRPESARPQAPESSQ